MTAGRGLAALLSALWLAVAARHLSLASFGRLALVLALHQIFFFLADPGTSVLLAEHVAIQRSIDARALRMALRQRLRGAALCIIVVAAAYAATTTGHGLVVPLLFSGSIIGNAIHTTCTAALRSVGRVGAETLNEPLSRLAMLAGGGWWLMHGGGLVACVAVYSLADLLSAGALYLVVRRALTHGVKGSSTLPDLSLVRGLPVAAGAALSTVYYRLDAWLVSILAGAGATALYSASSKLVEATLLPATVLGALVLAHAAGTSGSERTRMVRRFAIVALSITGALSAPLLLFAPRILTMAFGADFRASSTTLRILALSALAGAAVAALAPISAVSGGRRFPIAFGFATVANVGLNLLLIPTIGITGAAWANLISQCLLAGTLLSIALATPAARQLPKGQPTEPLVESSR